MSLVGILGHCDGCGRHPCDNRYMSRRVRAGCHSDRAIRRCGSIGKMVLPFLVREDVREETRRGNDRGQAGGDGLNFKSPCQNV